VGRGRCQYFPDGYLKHVLEQVQSSRPHEMPAGDRFELKKTERLEPGAWYTFESASGKHYVGKYTGKLNDGSFVIDYQGTGQVMVLQPERMKGGVIRKGRSVAWAHRLGPSEIFQIRNSKEGTLLEGSVLSFNDDGTARVLDLKAGEIVTVRLADYDPASFHLGHRGQSAGDAPTPIFQGVSPKMLPIDQVMQSPVMVRTQGGSLEPVYIFSKADGRAFAKAQGLLYENAPLTSLPRDRTYNYVILEDGSFVFGQETNALELGTKHVHLANGRGVVSAGEVRVDADGTFLLNNVSGSFARDLAKELGDQDLRSRTEKAFAAQGVPTRWGLGTTRRKPMTIEEIRAHCKVAVFAKVNSHLCP
jgi:hypothetical protein